MSKFFITRPIFATVIAILMIIAGLVTMDMLPVAQFPDITPPTVQVTALYPGASAETVAQTVGAPIEEQVNGVDGMLYMSSSSSSSGQYTLTVTFEVGTDIDMATVMVQNRVAIAESNLPQEVINQGITTQKQSTNIVMMLSLLSDKPELYNGLYLANYAKLNLTDQLTRLKGVGGVTVFGADNYSMRVWLDPDAMRIRQLVPADVYAAIQNQNLEVSAGSVGQPPVNSDEAFQFTLNSTGRLKTPEEFGNIILRTLPDGSYLRLKDVATIDLGSGNYNMTSLQKGKQTAAIAIYQLPGANSLEVAKAVREKMAELEPFFPESVTYNVLLDTTDFVSASIDEVLKTFIEATILVILVILLFLQNFRAVVIPAITIPVSLIATFAVMEALGFSINTLTLFGLVLAIAIVVDDAIVVIENATRLLDTGKYTRTEAVEKAMGEITGPVVGIVLVLSAVFIPTAFIGGITGQLYKQFALTIATATVFSGFNSLTFTPAMCALFLQPSQSSRFFIYRIFNKWYEKTQEKYVKIITYLLNKPVATTMVYLMITALTAWLFMKWPTSFIPQEDQGYFLVSVQLPGAASLQRTETVSAQISKILDEIPEIKSYMVINGFSIIQGAPASNNASIFVILKNWNERKKKSQSSFAIAELFNRRAAAIEEAQIFAVTPPAISGLGVSGGLEFMLEDRRNLGVGELQKAINDLMANVKSEPDIMMLNSLFQANTPQYYLRFDRNKIEMQGISLNQVFQTLSFYMGSAYVNDFIDFGRIYQVKLGADSQARAQIDDILKLSVKNSNGEMVPFSSFTTIEEQLGTNLINRYNMYTAASITCIPAVNASSQQAMTAMEQLSQNTLGENFGYDWTSVAYQEKESGSSVILIFGLAILVALLVLSAQYESWTSPVAVILGLPIALLGTLLGCLIMGLPISIYSQIGIILLIALSAKNAILIIEFARDYRASGKSITEASIEAGRVRLRPILMTSFAFILGVMPLVFATGAGAASRVSLGTAVVFGMTLNTLLGTLFIPNFYQMMQRLQEKFSPKRVKEVKAAPNNEV